MLSVIIVAAGSGKRMGGDIPKQFLEINGRSILEITLQRFVKTSMFDEIILVLSKDYFNAGEQLVSTFPNQKIILCEGGAERFHSVKNALNSVTPKCQTVFIHDAVRPFFTKKLLLKCIATCIKKDCAIPAIELKDSLRFIQADGINKAVDRANFRSIQTPQVFNFEKLQKAYQQDYSTIFTDDASVFEMDGNPIFLVEGETDNIKITKPSDLDWAIYKLSH